MPFISVTCICALSKSSPEQPVVSVVSGEVFEQRLIEAYIDQHGTDPVNGLPLTRQQLIVIPGLRAADSGAGRNENETEMRTSEEAADEPARAATAEIVGNIPESSVLPSSPSESVDGRADAPEGLADVRGDVQQVVTLLSEMSIVEDAGVLCEKERTSTVPDALDKGADGSKTPPSSEEAYRAEGSPDTTLVDIPSTVEDAGIDCEKGRTSTSPDHQSGTTTPDSQTGQSSPEPDRAAGNTTPDYDPGYVTASQDTSPDKYQLQTEDEAERTRICSVLTARKLLGLSATAVAPAPAQPSVDCLESGKMPPESIARLADDVKAGLEEHYGIYSGKNRKAKWLRAAHDRLLKKMSAKDADAADEQCNVVESRLPGGDRVVAGRMLIRTRDDADHVVLVGSVSMLFDDPLWCPYASVGQCPQQFCSDYCKDLKVHLQKEHHLNNVRLYLLCPFSGELDGEQQCREIVYDPQGMMLCNHVKRAHPDFADEIGLGLCCGYGEAAKDSSPGHKLYRRKLPSWVLQLKGKLPHEDIPEQICLPTFIDVRDDKLWYDCNQDCQDEVFASNKGLFEHLKSCHEIDINQTEVLHACPAQAEGCLVSMHVGSPHMLMHVEAVHPEMLGLSGEYSVKALKEREELEKAVEWQANQLRRELAKEPPLPEHYAGWIGTMYCPVADCHYEDREERLLIWHIGTSHQDVWNVN